jgi:hypothetical protein
MIMNRLSTLATITMLFAGVGLCGSNAVAQQKPLKEQLVGTWTLASQHVTRPDGTKYEPVGANPRGTFMLDANGHFALLILGEARPKFASNNRLEGTTEENKAAVQGSIAYFGTYTVSEADHIVNFHIERCTFPNWDGADQKRSITVAGDELKYTNTAASAGGKAELVWKRVK